MAIRESSRIYRVAVLGAALGTFSSAALAAGALAVRTTPAFQPMPFGWTADVMKSFEAPMPGRQAWSDLPLDSRDPRDWVAMRALSQVYASPQQIKALSASKDLRGVGLEFIARQARHTAARILETASQGAALDDQMLDASVIEAMFGRLLSDEKPALASKLSEALAAGRLRQSEAVRHEQLGQVLAWADRGRVLDLATQQRLEGEREKLKNRPDARRSAENAIAAGNYWGIPALSRRVHAMGPDEMTELGGLLRESMVSKWEPLRDLSRAKSDQEYLGAVGELAVLARRQEDPSAETRLMLRNAGLIAAELPQVAHQGRVGPAVERFGEYLARDRRNTTNFIGVRKSEFHHHLAVLLMFAEGARLADRREEGSPTAPRDAAIEAMLRDSTRAFLHSARGILSYSRLPLAGVVELAYPALDPALRGSARAHQLVKEGFAAAEGSGEAGSGQDKTLKRQLVEQGLLSLIPLVLLNGFLPAMMPLFMGIKEILILNAVALVGLLIQGLEHGNPSLLERLSSRWSLRRAAKKLAALSAAPPPAA